MSDGNAGGVGTEGGHCSTYYLDTVGGQVSDTAMLVMEVTLGAAFVIVNSCTVCANGGVKQRGRGGRVQGRGGGGSEGTTMW